ncbi:hypothetical protein AWH56_008820 [Anaerobacillus isosaccharinicus]|uniref:Uncharacterized protein n=1 Tax=Anaerobacillus isosaccharinicus TaxID=1532552 RepID=A0A1S2L1D4_9BACI|nr:hypothetical protein [Anaerobacillus isosaccharinicus]MBA5588925.1 hypothetical protein [Anaerobacillus isosaccharinicus]QOY37664.1 hypothetical protein AWH56_008820 [Anaerobacillus isosaccharinicus]
MLVSYENILVNQLFSSQLKKSSLCEKLQFMFSNGEKQARIVASIKKHGTYMGFCEKSGFLYRLDLAILLGDIVLQGTFALSKGTATLIDINEKEEKLLH